MRALFVGNHSLQQGVFAERGKKNRIMKRARSLKRPDPAPADPYKAQPLPVEEPIAVYYRQSSEGQIGNVSTTLQTVDMVEHLKRLGWVQERVLMIDMDAGVSGQKKIRERVGMSMLYDLIENSQVGAVAAQDVDRFFRDVTQIQTNIFIDACKRNNVLVLTPTMIYDFAHPTQGRYHMQMFRERAQQAADYLEYHIRGRLVRSRHYRSERGLWSGRIVAPGFMVDMRERLPDGSANPNQRKYVRFDAYADVVLAYFELFRAHGGNLKQTWLQIEREGPFFPEFDPALLPEGFHCRMTIDNRSPITGQLVPSESGLHFMLTNVVYIGHWIHQQAIVSWHNHEAIIPHDLFMFAFNKLSPTDFLGEPNPDYVPYRPWVRHDKDERQEEPPTYAYLAYSDDMPDHPHKRLACIWVTSAEHYKYQLADSPRRSNIWNIKAEIVDGLVDAMLLERLQATTVDESAWQAAVASVQTVDQADIRRVKAAIRQAETTKDNLIASLGLLSHPDMVQRAQARYEATEREIAALQAELDHLQSAAQRPALLADARPVLERVVTHWAQVPREEKRSLFEAFAHDINIDKQSRNTKIITVHWRDGSATTRRTTERSLSYYWDNDDLEKLQQMMEGDVDQWEILRAFPSYTWKALQERYAYHFGNGSYRKAYQGKRPYPNRAKWADTEEYQAELSQLASSMASTDRSRPAFFYVCGRFWPLR
jgi:ketosteroid isomerase-like protein